MAATNINASESNILALAGSSIILLLLSRIAIQASTWSKDRALLSYFFEDNSEFILALTVYIPIILLLSVLAVSGEKKYRIVSIFGFLYGTVFWFISYNFTSGARTIFSQLNGFYPMSKGLADWMNIPLLVRCRASTGCIYPGIPNGYGNGWRLLSPLASDGVAVILGGLMTGYVCYAVGRFSERLGVPIVGLMLFLSPSMVFSIERGQPDIFLVGLILIFLRIKKVRTAANVLIAMALLSMKPFFVTVFLRDRPKVSRILLFSPLFLFTYFFSMNFDFKDVQNVRVATIYWPKSQFGIDQLPSLAIQLFDKKYHVNEQYWQGGTSFGLALMIGLIFFVVVYLISTKSALLRLKELGLDSLGVYERNVILVFSSLYLLIYLSGSEVAYKTWVVFPVLIISLRRFLELKERAKPSFIIFMSLILFGGFAVDIWTLRSIGTFILAIYCAHIVSYFYKDTFPLSKIGRIKGG